MYKCIWERWCCCWAWWWSVLFPTTMTFTCDDTYAITLIRTAISNQPSASEAAQVDDDFQCDFTSHLVFCCAKLLLFYSVRDESRPGKCYSTYIWNHISYRYFLFCTFSFKININFHILNGWNGKYLHILAYMYT